MKWSAAKPPAKRSERSSRRCRAGLGGMGEQPLPAGTSADGSDTRGNAGWSRRRQQLRRERRRSGSDGDGGASPAPSPPPQPAGPAGTPGLLGTVGTVETVGTVGTRSHVWPELLHPHGRDRDAGLVPAPCTARAGDTCGAGDRRVTSPAWPRWHGGAAQTGTHRSCCARAILEVPPTRFGVKPCRIWVSSVRGGKATPESLGRWHPALPSGCPGTAGVPWYPARCHCHGTRLCQHQPPARPRINQPALLLINNPLDLELSVNMSPAQGQAQRL